MNPQEINKRIAIACGWKIRPNGIFENGDYIAFEKDLPNYHGDLNAMHEAETILENDQADQYEEELAKITGGLDYLFHIPADQRAEAFLRTIGQWEDEK